ncbi:hypothetical protein [Streptomyces sp. NPDC088915]|uniref:hypothetical protein n=1 Tax=Streptomyces sp. NPDC088915 TaxID=3365912 RepID=UPI0038071D10
MAVTDEADEFLAFCDSPAEHWVRLRLQTASASRAVTASSSPTRRLRHEPADPGGSYRVASIVRSA